MQIELTEVLAFFLTVDGAIAVIVFKIPNIASRESMELTNLFFRLIILERLENCGNIYELGCYSVLHRIVSS